MRNSIPIRTVSAGQEELCSKGNFRAIWKRRHYCHRPCPRPSAPPLLAAPTHPQILKPIPDIDDLISAYNTLMCISNTWDFEIKTRHCAWLLHHLRFFKIRFSFHLSPHSMFFFWWRNQDVCPLEFAIPQDFADLTPIMSFNRFHCTIFSRLTVLQTHHIQVFIFYFKC